MKRSEFLKNYFKGVPEDDQIRQQIVAIRCACGDSKCSGWAAVVNQPLNIRTHLELYAPSKLRQSIKLRP